MDVCCLQLECCGSASYQDWYDVDWSGEGARDAVPPSCCNQTAPESEDEKCDGSRTDDIYTHVRSLDDDDDDDDERSGNRLMVVVSVALTCHSG